MIQVSEKGHTANVTNLKTLIVLCTSYGASYTPAYASLKLANLNVLQTKGADALNAVNLSLDHWKEAVGERETAFEALPALFTAVMAAANTADIPAYAKDNIKTIYKKLKGGHKAKPAATKPADPNAQTTPTHATNNTSKLDVPSRLANLEALITQLQVLLNYAPNEANLTTASLVLVLKDLNDKNDRVITTAIALEKQRDVRDSVLYAPETGLVDIALNVKEYVKSVFNASSNEYKQVLSLKFRNFAAGA